MLTNSKFAYQNKKEYEQFYIASGVNQNDIYVVYTVLNSIY